VSVNGRRSDTTASDGSVSLSFGRALGFAEATVARTSVAAFRPRSTMFEMDITGSFLTVSCAIDQAIAADITFLDGIYKNGIAADKIGMDVFTGGAKNFTPLQSLASTYVKTKGDWKGDGAKSNLAAHKTGLGACTKAPDSTTGDYLPCPNGPTGIWPNQAKLSSTMSNISCSYGDFHYAPATPGVYGGTNIGAGIKSGIDALNVSAKPYEVRSIVVFTDGGPVCCEDPEGGHTCGKIDGATGKYMKPCCADALFNPCVDNIGGKACKCATDVAAYGVQQANAALAAGIDVYVLAFGNNPDWVGYAQSLTRGRGFALDTSDPARLQSLLLQFANNIPVALVK
jgi:hypothetical protein